MQIDILTAITFLGLPSATSAFCFWLIKRKMDKNQKQTEEREQAKHEHQILLIDLSYASLSLGEANAIAIKNNECNGEMSCALEYAKDIKHKHRDFINKQGIKTL